MIRQVALALGSHRDVEELLRKLGVTYTAGSTNDGSVLRKYGVTGMTTKDSAASIGECSKRAAAS